MPRPLLYISALLLLLSQCAKDKSTNTPPPNTPTAISTLLSFSANPSGNWQIGYSTGDTLVYDQFQLCTYADTTHIIGIWHPATGQAGYYPYTGQNKTDTIQTDATNSWAARPGEIVMEGSGTGQYSMLRFVVPATGKYKLKATFEGVHSRLSSTDVHILLNAQSLLSDVIDGYGGDSLFHAITGAHPSVSYSNTLQLQQGDIITFAIGYGVNKTNYNDTTGLLVEVEEE